MATEQVVEQVAEHLEDAAEVTRQVDPTVIKYFLGGVGVGVVVGFYLGWKWNKEKIRAQYYADSEEEIRQIRETYQEVYAARNKPDLEEAVEERGYKVVEERPLPAPVPVREPDPLWKPKPEWDYAHEIKKRHRNHPYIIHQDEFNERTNGYTQLTWTYYAADNILVDENDEIVVRPELTVGEANLTRFGHGSDDDNVVFVRNDRIEIEWEVCRTLKSYEVEILGMDGAEDEPEDVDAT